MIKVTAIFVLALLVPLNNGFGGELKIPSDLQQGDLVPGNVTPGARVIVDGQNILVDKDGFFVFGLGRDYSQKLLVEARFTDGTSLLQTYNVRKRKYGEQHIEGIPKEMVTPDIGIAERISMESDLVRLARRNTSYKMFFRSGFIIPTVGTITGVFGTRRFLNGEPRSPHYGIDIAAQEGTTVVAAADGIIRLSAKLYLSGNTTIVDHGYGVSSTYLHMEKIIVGKNDFVRQGQVIGYVGTTGRSTGPHLDWRMNWFDVRVDPERAMIFLPPNSH